MPAGPHISLCLACVCRRTRLTCDPSHTHMQSVTRACACTHGRACMQIRVWVSGNARSTEHTTRINADIDTYLRKTRRNMCRKNYSDEKSESGVCTLDGKNKFKANAVVVPAVIKQSRTTRTALRRSLTLTSSWLSLPLVT